MKRLMITAANSGSGKTTITCALLRALQRRGIMAEGFKCGPDYIDPMFQRRVLGVPCKNLDLFLQGRAGVLRTMAGQTGEIAVLEGAMGYYDGQGGTEQGSAWDVACLTHTPAILVLHPTGVGVTLAAQVKGLLDFRSPSNLVGILLNDVKPSLYAYLKPILERECGLPVFGYLPHCPEASFESRHLGLVTADEIADFDRRFDALAQLLEENANLDALLAVAAEAGEGKAAEEHLPAGSHPAKRCRIAVARDAAFCFYYEENLHALENAGAELCFFSPLNGELLPPETDGIYIGGGYPELYTQKLGENTALWAQLRKAVSDGLPLIAECGGFLTLQRRLDGVPMASVLPGVGFETGRLQRFGYVTLTAERDSMLFRASEPVPAHEFHYWDCSENGTDLQTEKSNGMQGRCGFCTARMYAGFPHLHFGGALPLAQRFVECASVYHEERITGKAQNQG